ncbi:MAG TPA: hypothetical protein VJ741_21450 [Solirubrobacteraceae bacterium]|nr:hypothetical protein [Solirubrobacteraceae bacterium]
MIPNGGASNCRRSSTDIAVANIPPNLQVPTSAVPPAQSIVVQTRPYEGEGVRRDAGSFPVLAIGWYSSPAEPFVYLVFDRQSHDIFWVAHSMVERVVSGAGMSHR